MNGQRVELSSSVDTNEGGDKRMSRRKTSEPAIRIALRSRVILFVDDEPLVQKARRIIFEALGYSVLTADSGKEALSLLHSSVVNAVVLNCCMSGIDGEDTARQIRVMHPG